MPLGLLIVIYIITIPFLSEAEKNGIINKGRVNWMDVIKLKIFLTERWRYAYFVFLALFAALFLGPTENGEVYHASFFNVLVIMCTQSVLWGIVSYRNFKIRRDGKNGKWFVCNY